MTHVDGEMELRIDVDPEPTAAEMAAIVAAIRTLSLSAKLAEPRLESRTHGRDRWAQAGRREVLRPLEWERPHGQSK
jgi:hypothetical protein